LSGVATEPLFLLLGEEGGIPLPGEQVELIQDAIGKNRADIAVPFSLPRLCARYAQRQVPAQKKILKDLEKAATFKRNRDAYLVGPEQCRLIRRQLHSRARGQYPVARMNSSGLPGARRQKV